VKVSLIVSSWHAWQHDLMSTSSVAEEPLPPIVDAAWLRRRIAAEPTLVVCHVGSTMPGSDPLADFEQRHVPGARLLSLDDALADVPSGTAGRHPLPSPEAFAAALGTAGVGDDAAVVAYDDRGGAHAARLVWMLRITGARAALLDGGLDAWEGRLEHGRAVTDAVPRAVRPWPCDALADAADVVRHIADGGVVIDSRDPARYRGELEPIDPVAGHVPGAVNAPFADNLDADGRFHSAEELTERFQPVVGTDDRPIVYCGSGVTACHNALAMERAGLGRPRVYVGSWSGWIADPDRPIASGPTP
jgi:thiosulfate/3-mercaptopyruvate sulfurtransferase